MESFSFPQFLSLLLPCLERKWTLSCKLHLHQPQQVIFKHVVDMFVTYAPSGPVKPFSGYPQFLGWVVPFLHLNPDLPALLTAPSPHSLRAQNKGFSEGFPLSLETLSELSLPFPEWRLYLGGSLERKQQLGLEGRACSKRLSWGSWKTALPSWGSLCIVKGKEQEAT